MCTMLSRQLPGDWTTFYLISADNILHLCSCTHTSKKTQKNTKITYTYTVKYIQKKKYIYITLHITTYYINVIIKENNNFT